MYALTTATATRSSPIPALPGSPPGEGPRHPGEAADDERPRPEQVHERLADRERRRPDEGPREQEEPDDQDGGRPYPLASPAGDGTLLGADAAGHPGLLARLPGKERAGARRATPARSTPRPRRRRPGRRAAADG